MSIRFDEKGKFFTDFISKEAVPVIIQTHQFTIEGLLHIRPDERLKDEINRAEPFLALTDVTVSNSNGTLMYHSNFIAVNHSHILWILPQEDIISDVQASGGQS